jgi:hypothetical protein
MSDIVMIKIPFLVLVEELRMKPENESGFFVLCVFFLLLWKTVVWLRNGDIQLNRQVFMAKCIGSTLTTFDYPIPPLYKEQTIFLRQYFCVFV